MARILPTFMDVSYHSLLFFFGVVYCFFLCMCQIFLLFFDFLLLFCVFVLFFDISYCHCFVLLFIIVIS